MSYRAGGQVRRLRTTYEGEQSRRGMSLRVGFFTKRTLKTLVTPAEKWF